jgi:hypothetical protein
VVGSAKNRGKRVCGMMRSRQDTVDGDVGVDMFSPKRHDHYDDRYSRAPYLRCSSFCAEPSEHHVDFVTQIPRWMLRIQLSTGGEHDRDYMDDFAAHGLVFALDRPPRDCK